MFILGMLKEQDWWLSAQVLVGGSRGKKGAGFDCTEYLDIGTFHL